MDAKFLSQENLKKLLQDILATDVELYAPRADPTRPGREPLINFAKIDPASDGGDICFDFTNTRLSPKEILFPRTESILEMELFKSDVKLTDPDVAERDIVVFGIRPCDAAAFFALDALFGWDYKDKFYLERRERTTLIGLSCTEPTPQCFCTSVGVSPTSADSCDLFLTQLNKNFLVEIITEKGNNIVEQNMGLFTELNNLADVPSKDEVTKEIEGKLKRSYPLLDVKPKLDANFSDKLWVELSRKCIGCGICAFVCPSCHCFDITDDEDLKYCSRRKNWDSCCFKLYSLHASGHNPRDTQDKRYRNRVMHKFSYFVDRFNITKCSGCGRCGSQCPVNLDIYDVVKTFDESFGYEESLVR